MTVAKRILRLHEQVQSTITACPERRDAAQQALLVAFALLDGTNIGESEEFQERAAGEVAEDA